MAGANEAYLALAGALMGGSGLKIIEYLLNRPKERNDDAAEFRTELREEVKTLREELRKTELEVEKWRQQYYEVMDAFIKFRAGQNDPGVNSAGTENSPQVLPPL